MHANVVRCSDWDQLPVDGPAHCRAGRAAGEDAPGKV